jgi:hypothetical protein
VQARFPIGGGFGCSPEDYVELRCISQVSSRSIGFNLDVDDVVGVVVVWEYVE